MNNSSDFRGKVAFVTGAANGIGRATALAFAREARSVVVADVSEEANQEDGEPDRGAKRAGARGPLRRDASRGGEGGSGKDGRSFRALDFAFNNAGIEPRKPAPTADYDEEEWNRIIDINLRGVIPVHEARDSVDPRTGRRRDCQHVLGCRNHRHQGQPCLHRGEARRDRPDQSGSARLRRTEYPHQRRLSRLHRTPMMERFTGGTPEGRAKVIAEEPVGRMGKPEEIAAAVVWLCSDAAAFVIGHAMVIDGGQTVP